MHRKGLGQFLRHGRLDHAGAARLDRLHRAFERSYRVRLRRISVVLHEDADAQIGSALLGHISGQAQIGTLAE